MHKTETKGTYKPFWIIYTYIFRVREFIYAVILITLLPKLSTVYPPKKTFWGRQTLYDLDISEA